MNSPLADVVILETKTTTIDYKKTVFCIDIQKSNKFRLLRFIM